MGTAVFKGSQARCQTWRSCRKGTPSMALTFRSWRVPLRPGAMPYRNRQARVEENPKCGFQHVARSRSAVCSHKVNKRRRRSLRLELAAPSLPLFAKRSRLTFPSAIGSVDTAKLTSFHTLQVKLLVLFFLLRVKVYPMSRCWNMPLRRPIRLGSGSLHRRSHHRISGCQ
jgi:hypothetical protein